MQHARPLPPELLARYRAWQERRTAGGHRPATPRPPPTRQSPKAMIITCCDSRVLISEIFGNEPGDFFIHRNIANLVPPSEPDGRSHGTSAAIEYAVIALRIEHLIVMGHHGCGGVRGCHDMLAGLAPDLDTPTSFVGTWLKILKPGYEALAGRGLAYEARIGALEREAILVSLDEPHDLPLRRRSGPGGQARAARALEGHPRRRASRPTTARPAASRGFRDPRAASAPPSRPSSAPGRWCFRSR